MLTQISNSLGFGWREACCSSRIRFSTICTRGIYRVVFFYNSELARSMKQCWIWYHCFRSIPKSLEKNFEAPLRIMVTLA